jgi:hypothetical protein
MEPRTYAWIIPDRLAVAERPGGGGRSHRRARRDEELGWWREQGITQVVSGMRSKHGLLEAALAGFLVHWCPLADLDEGPRQLGGLVATVLRVLESGPVLVHVDRPGEWLAAVDAALRLSVGAAKNRKEALAQVAADGLPIGEITRTLLTAPPRSYRAVAA